METLQNNNIITLIESRLQAAFTPTLLEIIDDSDAHLGHSQAASGGGHFLLKIRSPHFKNISRIQQHRLVYTELGDLIPTQIHALGLDTGC